MTRKNYSLKVGARVAKRFDWYMKRTKKSDIWLGGLRAEWNESHAPYFAWQAIDVCIREKIKFPDWVYQYLGECAQRMLSPDAVKASDLRKVLPRIMGFPPRRGRGNPLEPDGDNWLYTGPAMRFAAEIFEGANPTAALSSAFELLDQGIADKMDNKTLQSHIKKFFGMSHAPRTNAGWRGPLLAWGRLAFGPFAKESRDLSPRD